MQIDGIKPGSNISKTKTKKKVSQKKFSLDDETIDNDVEMDSIENDAVTPVQNQGGGLTMFAQMQEKNKRHKKVVDHSNNLLNQLENIKNQIILGNLTDDVVMQLKSITEQEKIVIEDVQLRQLYEFIQQRAKIELAKLGII